MSGLSALQKTLAQFQQIEAVAFASTASRPANLGQGSSMGGVFNAGALLGLSLQAQIDYVATLTRLYDANGQLQVFGADIDSLFNPYGCFREQAAAATTVMTFTLPSVTTTTVVAVPVGAIVQRASDDTQYLVIADATQTSLQGKNYVVTPAGSGSDGQTCSFTVMCLTAGSIGNTAENTITQPYGGPGVAATIATGTITNPNAVTNGIDAESDTAYVTRFQAFMLGGTVGTPTALLAAALGVQANLTVQIGDTLNSSGVETISYSSVFVNVLGQSAGPGSALEAAVRAAVDAVRAAGMKFDVFAPTLLNINLLGSIKCDGSVASATVVANAEAAATTYVNNVGMAPIQSPTNAATTVVSYSRIIAAIMVVPGVAYVSNLLVNGGTADITVGYGIQAISASTSFQTE